MPPVEAVLVQTMYGTFERPIGHKPTDAELDAIKDEYVAQGLDVISGGAVESPRIPPYQNAYEPLPEEGWGRPRGTGNRGRRGRLGLALRSEFRRGRA